MLLFAFGCYNLFLPEHIAKPDKVQNVPLRSGGVKSRRLHKLEIQVSQICFTIRRFLLLYQRSCSGAHAVHLFICTIRLLYIFTTADQSLQIGLSSVHCYIVHLPAVMDRDDQSGSSQMCCLNLQQQLCVFYPNL